MAFRVGKTKFGELVEAALSELPPPFDGLIEEIAIEVRDAPTRAQLASVRLESGRLLLGLYQGRPRHRRSVEDSGYLPDQVFIFQNAIEAVCGSEAELAAQVRKTVLHEIGHHFGMDEDDLEKLGYQ